MRLYNYSFLEHGMLPAGLVNTVSAISELRGREKELMFSFNEVFDQLQSIAILKSVKASNEIEGFVTTDQRMQEIINQNSKPQNHDEEEIAGYRDALNLIHTGQNDLDIKESDILRLHEIMLKYSRVKGGQYKTTDNVIMESVGGVRQVRFTPVPAEQTPQAMQQLILAYLEARSNYNINQLLLIPCFILDFLCIHPFLDGNGRMSRLLSLLMLYQNGFDAGRYISFEEQINRNKEWYYRALQSSSANWHEGQNSYFPFIENFVATLLYCYKELDKHFATVHSKKVSKSERISATVLNSLLPISKSEICYILPDVSPTTVEAVLADMLKQGLIEKMGNARNTKYRPL